MAYKDEKRIRELHKKLMKGFMKQIDESISNIQRHMVGIKDHALKDDSAALSTKGASRVEQDHSGPDKINEIRNEAAATQLMQTLNPDEQRELMEIVKHRSEEFEGELHRMPLLDIDTIKSSTQKFKDELMDNVHNRLTQMKHALETDKDLSINHHNLKKPVKLLAEEKV